MSGKGLRQLQVLNHPFRLLLSEEPLPRAGPWRARASLQLPRVSSTLDAPIRGRPDPLEPQVGAWLGPQLPRVRELHSSLPHRVTWESRARGLLGAARALNPGPTRKEGRIGGPRRGQGSLPRPGPIPVCGKGSLHASLLLRWPGASLARVRAVPLGVLEWGGCQPAGKVGAVRWGLSGSWWLSPEWVQATPGCSDGCDPQGLGSSQSDPRPTHRDTGTKHTCVLAGVRLVLPGPSSKSRALGQRGEGSREVGEHEAGHAGLRGMAPWTRGLLSAVCCPALGRPPGLGGSLGSGVVTEAGSPL